MSNHKVIIYTDGACSGNQNVTNYGGWGAVMICEDMWSKEELLRKEMFGGELNTTNNKMELTAVIKALKNLKKKNLPVEVYVDSNYVLQGITQWIEGWKARGWRKADKKPVENVELWKELDHEVSQYEKINFFKVKAHVGIELNELADQLANKGIRQAIGEVILP